MPSPATQAATVEAQAQSQRDEAEVPVTLVFRFGGGHRLVELRAAALIVGRGSACDLQLHDPSLSRQHARFVRDGQRLRIEDLGSRNGVGLRGQRVQQAHLESGDVVELGDVRVSVHLFASTRVPLAEPAEQGEVSWAGQGMHALRVQLEKVAPTPLPVLVLGETGTGKELIARELHRLSPRAAGPLRVVNCAAIPATLIESTLFGHERGAFTGADRAQAGVFEQAGDGTVFLDELGELSLAAQAALLRVLETGRFNRVGGSRELESQARVVAATHRDLQAMVSEGGFRLDLLHRLDTISLRLPPLRERLDAFEPLVQRFLEGACRTMQKPPRHVGTDAMALLRAYPWPGNVRELRNVIERAVAIADTPVIGVADLPERLREASAGPASVAPGVAGELSAGMAGEAAAALKEKHAVEERELLVRALEQAGGSQTEAAVRLGWSLRTLQRRARKYGLSRPRR